MIEEKMDRSEKYINAMVASMSEVLGLPEKEIHVAVAYVQTITEYANKK